MSKTLIIIQARLSSTRMPGKVLAPLHNIKSLLDIQVENLIDLGHKNFVIATTTNKADDRIVSWAEKRDIPTFRGDEDNVLKRFIDCSKHYGAERIIRVCSDNPFLQMNDITEFENVLSRGVDYVSYADSHGTPAIRKHWGLFVEGVSVSGLKRAQEMLIDHPEKRFYKEHVTNYLYGHEDSFNLHLEEAPDSVLKRNDLRFTIDTPEDFENMKNLFHKLNYSQPGSLEELVNCVDTNPEILSVMSNGIERFSK